MPGIELDAAVDDYLHAIVRTRPWTRQREEEVLSSFSDWMYEQPGQSVELAAVTPSVLRQYRDKTGLDEAEQVDLETTMTRLLLWAEINGHLKGNGQPADVTR